MGKTLFILSFLIQFSLIGQNFQKVISGPNDEQGQAIITTSDGGYAVAGYTNSFGAGNKDFFIIKMNSAGAIIWQKTYGGSNDEAGFSIVMEETPDGGILVGGISYSFNANAGDLYILKVDSNGTVVWDGKYTSASNLEYARSFSIAPNGDILVMGTDNVASFGSADGVVLRLNAMGGLIWSKVYGGGDNDHLHTCEFLPSGNMILCGYSKSYGPGNTAGYLLKTNSSGDIIWDKTYGGNNVDGYNSSAYTNDNNIILTGLTNSYGAGNFDVLVSKIDTNGVLIWSKTFGGVNFERGASIKIIPNSNDFLLLSNTESYGGGKDLLIIRLDPQGNIVWSKTFGSPYIEAVDQWAHNSIATTNDGGFIMTAYSDSLGNGSAGEEILLVKVDSSNTILCNDVLLSTTSPVMATNNPTSGTATTGSYTVVNTIEATSNFSIIDTYYCIVPPVAEFSSSDTTICANDCIDFSDLSVGTNINTYSWAFEGADILNSNLSNPTNICYSTPGTYDVTLVVTDDYGSDSITIIDFITVEPCLPPVASFITPDTICAGECIDLIDTSFFQPTAWSWDIQGGSPSSSTSQNNYGVCFLNAGDYAITLTVNNIYGSDDTTIIIHVLPIPSAGSDSSISVCSSEADFQLVQLLNGADNNNGIWENSTTGTISNGTFSPQTNGAGVYSFIYIIENNNCSDTSDFVITVTPTNNAGTGADLIVCDYDLNFNLFNELSNNPSPGGTWVPSLNLGGNVYAPGSDADGVYYYVVNDNADCMSDTATVTTTTIALPTPSIVAPDVLCIGLPDLTLSASPLGGTWTGSGIIDNSTGLFSTDNISDGVHSISYTIDSLGCFNTTTEQIVILGEPEIDSIPDYNWCYDELLVIEFENNDSTEINWSTGDTSTILNLGFNEDDIGITNTYSIEVSNDCGTHGQTFQVTITDCDIYVFIPNTFTPNGDEFNNLFGPSITGSPITNFKFEIYNRWGELIFESSNENNFWDGTYKGRYCQDGIYTWKLRFDSLKQPANIYTGHVSIYK